MAFIKIGTTYINTNQIITIGVTAKGLGITFDILSAPPLVIMFSSKGKLDEGLAEVKAELRKHNLLAELK